MFLRRVLFLKDNRKKIKAGVEKYFCKFACFFLKQVKIYEYVYIEILKAIHLDEDYIKE